MKWHSVQCHPLGGGISSSWYFCGHLDVRSINQPNGFVPSGRFSEAFLDCGNPKNRTVNTLDCNMIHPITKTAIISILLFIHKTVTDIDTQTESSRCVCVEAKRNILFIYSFMVEEIITERLPNFTSSTNWSRRYTDKISCWCRPTFRKQLQAWNMRPRPQRVNEHLLRDRGAIAGMFPLSPEGLWDGGML
jgi:hypothetical protein